MIFPLLFQVVQRKEENKTQDEGKGGRGSTSVTTLVEEYPRKKGSLVKLGIRFCEISKIASSEVISDLFLAAAVVSRMGSVTTEDRRAVARSRDTSDSLVEQR